jgi:predicted dehydrogenase
MAPHADSPTFPEEAIDRLPAPERPQLSEQPPRFMIIGAGSRGGSYARAIGESTNGVCVAIAEPIAYKRQNLGRTFIWGKAGPSEGQEFEDWKDFVTYEEERRRKAAAGETVPKGIDGVFICVQDGLHKEVIVGIEHLGLHIMCEKPLATTLNDCVSILRSLLSKDPKSAPTKIFSIGHVLRYSPHNMLLRKLLLEEKVIGEVLSINHTEPVGWWHFSHSYVRSVNQNFQYAITNVKSFLFIIIH